MRSFAFRVLLLNLLLPLAAMADAQAFPPTAAGSFELKTLPAGVLLQSEGRGSYFDSANNLFGPLFRYISSHDIAMTTPVEARIDQAAMYFWVAPSERSKVDGSKGGVKVLEVPERFVASLGYRGSYSRGNFEEARTKLLAWVAEQPGVTPAGDAYAVYWNGPFVPGFLKRAEVHVPVKKR